MKTPTSLLLAWTLLTLSSCTSDDLAAKRREALNQQSIRATAAQMKQAERDRHVAEHAARAALLERQSAHITQFNSTALRATEGGTLPAAAPAPQPYATLASHGPLTAPNDFRQNRGSKKDAGSALPVIPTTGSRGIVEIERGGQWATDANGRTYRVHTDLSGRRTIEGATTGIVEIEKNGKWAVEADGSMRRIHTDLTGRQTVE